MGIDIQITLKNDEEIKGLFKKLRKIWTQRPMVQAMDEALEILQEDAKFYAPHWHGDLRDSIMISTSEMGDTEFIGEVFSDSPYAVAQEEGVPAGYWMNMDNMTEWVLDKWGDSSFEPPGFELAIWLHAYGIEAKWFFEQAIQNNEMRLAHKYYKALEIVITSKG
jgi:hypothetical protein